jgi:hypothetical protein
LLRKAVDNALAVLPDALDEIRCDADIKHTVGLACQNVDVTGFVYRSIVSFLTGWTMMATMMCCGCASYLDSRLRGNDGWCGDDVVRE